MLAEYLADDPAVTAWFAGPWRDQADLLAAPLPEVDRQALLAVLTPILAQRQAPAASQAQAALLGDPAVAVIAAGQQPAYGGGPLLSLVKAIECQLWAEQLSAAGRPTVALFWVASDDHDHDEANRCDLIHRDGRIERLRTRYATPGAALHRQAAAAGWQQLLSALDNLPGGHLGRDFLHQQAPQDDHEGLGHWFARLLEQSCPGLIVIEAKHLRPLWQQQLKKLVSRSGEVAAGWPQTALAQRAAAIRQQQFSLAFDDLSQPPLFVDDASGRSALAAGRPWNGDQLSPGAAIRPVLQQAVLPVIGWIGGPGELRYHAQIGPIYQAMDLVMPRFIARRQITLLPSWWQRGRSAWGQNEHLAGSQPDDLVAQLSALMQQQQQTISLPTHLNQQFAALDQALAEASNDLSNPQRRRFHHSHQQLGKLRQQLTASLQRGARQDQQRLALGALRAWLRPRDSGQDRVLALTQALAAYGPGLVTTIRQAMTTSEPTTHQAVML